MRGLQE